MTPPKEPLVHIYTLSHLVYARVGSWERVIDDLEHGRKNAYSYYQPMREAVIAYSASGGSGRDELVARMLEEARQRPHGRGQDPEGDNLTAFEVFETACYPKMGRFVRGLLRQGTGVFFEGVRLNGTPHMLVHDKTGAERYVFLHASQWHPDNLKAYLELLGIVAEKAFGAPSRSILHVDLRSGSVRNHRPSPRVRKNCADAARHYVRVFGNTGLIPSTSASAERPTS